ncbi:hypothetical protein [Chitinophaga sancti]|uniref:Uncharacterized protein n=1 Tax=Chitinophaga sancti TaxID=1004 RepID=A0A1K1PR56_9BACT|nr:hypothetical protein [Chitinophaga sancti]WQD61747.1 hypothetical protein U0033_28095 [Chitinophaga sancti]WQG92695.1 hypothetical protein SR876_14345 [Chitinophaga sancti]SFW49996.1 hypothetical protein SAMN05661012_02118 [Chitinophaga sancti]
MPTLKLTPDQRRRYASAFLISQVKLPQKVRIEGVIENKVYCWNGRIALVVNVEEEYERVYAEIDNEVKTMFFHELKID